jgi:DNA-binding response OmpR family regulator
VLLDIGLPGIDGYSVATQLRAEEDIGEPALVAITGYGQEENRRRSHEAGFDFHLVKPNDFNTLRLILERIRQLARSEHRGPSCAPDGKSRGARLQVKVPLRSPNERKWLVHQDPSRAVPKTCGHPRPSRFSPARLPS